MDTRGNIAVKENDLLVVQKILTGKHKLITHIEWNLDKIFFFWKNYKLFSEK